VAWSAAFAYEGVVREAVARAKYHGSHASLRGLGDHAASAWHDLAAQAGLARPDVVTWAPTAPARRRARGVDHARVLAQVVAARLGVPAVAVLARPDGPAQTVLPAASRRAGPPVRSRRPVVGVVLLVDDVATTGGTARACAGALLRAGAREVTACTIARTPPGRH
jgi:predicted amidophosphoribosyltransferase